MFNAMIVKAPKEGLMGLDRNGNPIILHDGDMISLNAVDREFAKVLFIRRMAIGVRFSDRREVKSRWFRRKRLERQRSLGGWVKCRG